MGGGKKLAEGAAGDGADSPGSLGVGIGKPAQETGQNSGHPCQSQGRKRNRLWPRGGGRKGRCCCDCGDVAGTARRGPGG